MLIAKVVETVTLLDVTVTDSQESVTAVVSSADETLIATINDGGARGPAGPAAATTYARVAGVTLSALTVVWEDASGVVWPLDYRDDAHIDLIVGVVTSAGAAGNEVTIQRSGPLDAAGLGLVAGRVWLGVNGSLTNTPPTDGYDVLIGHATSLQRLYIDTQDNIKLEV